MTFWLLWFHARELDKENSSKIIDWKIVVFNAKLRSYDNTFGSLIKINRNHSKIQIFRTSFKDLKNLSKFKSLSPVLSCCRGYCSAHPPSLPERAGEPACLERILSNVKMLKKLVILRNNKLKSAKSIAEMLRFQLESTSKGCWWMSVDKKNILVKTKKWKVMDCYSCD